MVEDPDTGINTLIGVLTDSPYTLEEYKQAPVTTSARVTEVLPWIYDVMNGKILGEQLR